MTAAIFAFQFIVQTIQTLISMSVMYIMFENPLYGNFCTFFSLMMITGTAGIFYGSYRNCETLMNDTTTSEFGLFN